jgi:D-glycero-beta-D-manno-heptose 1-phosphate adenylyltransferase
MSFGCADIIDDYGELRDCLSSERDGKVVVCTIGSWDILHRGHTEYLKRARDLGDILVVGVDSDRAYHQYKNKEALYPQRDRQEIVSGLRYVDYVTIVNDVDLSGEWRMDLIKSIQPDIFVCNERSYPVEQRKKLEGLCPIEVLPFYVPPTASSSAAISEQIKSVFVSVVNVYQSQGIVQTGAGALAALTIKQDGEGRREIERALEAVERTLEQAGSLGSAERNEALELVSDVKNELQRDNPNGSRIRGALQGLGTVIQTVALTPEVYQLLKGAAALLGIQLP